MNTALATRPLLTAEELLAKAVEAAQARAALWDHRCPVEGAGFFVGAGEPCAWCGAEQPTP